MQLSHKDNRFTSKKHPIIIVCDNINNSPNLGSILRLADAFNVQEVRFCGENIPIGRRMQKTSRSSEKNVVFSNPDSALNEMQKFKNSNYKIIALEITNNSHPISKISLNSNQSVVLILGDENYGISEEILLISDVITHIDMFGNNSNMNVASAAAIALYEITKQQNNQ